ncbi:GntR family transcriptional regulator [Alloalcanivorax xenomutans]|uniref:GntR family transcriptional regulator n=1 Tax=Alloalcanivorax TaxID=3020832 RepID=UPI0021CD5965|nr:MULTISPECIES: GntR family transcriptional regulator [Alloalcanivorax]WOA32171.1 GntR family transcriptional regulator [Alloalcanivorax xenomutans]WOD29135.1 GntR family transcriptional regulator [Alloalcanivorax xenomutans]
MKNIKLNASGTALHRQLFLTLREQILGGQFHYNDRLPTQNELAERYGVSRITVRRALAELQSEGLVRNEQGSGSFVAKRTQVGDALGRDHSLLDDMRRVVEETHVAVLNASNERPPGHIQALFGLDEGDVAPHVVRVRGTSRKPLMLLDAWMSPSLGDAVLGQDLTRLPLWDVIVSNIAGVGEVVQEVSAELATPSVAQALEADVNAPILRVTRLVHDAAGQPVQRIVIRTVAGRSRLLMKVAGVDIDSASAGYLVHDGTR